MRLRELKRALDAENLYLLFNLAAVYANQGNYEKAERLYMEEYLEKRRVVLGEATPILSIL